VNTDTCQSEIVNIDSASTVALYQLATIGVTQSLSIDQQGEAHFINMCFRAHSISSAVLASASNNEGTQSTITLWTSS
jgi:glucan 1,3-beta-glucosidase